MKNNYILNLRQSGVSGYTFINSYSDTFNSIFNQCVCNTFVKLEGCGYKLLNIDDYPDWAGIPIASVFDRVMLFRDVEFYNAFQTKKNEILVRWIKIERTGYVKMKQVLFTDSEHLKRPIKELVTAASAKDYNITISSDKYNMLRNIIVPYNIKGLLLINEFDRAVNMYLEDDFDYLSGELPTYIKTRKNIIRQSFMEVVDEDINGFLNLRPKILTWGPIGNEDVLFNAAYIKENTYYY